MCDPKWLFDFSEVHEITKDRINADLVIKSDRKREIINFIIYVLEKSSASTSLYLQAAYAELSIDFGIKCIHVFNSEEFISVIKDKIAYFSNSNYNYMKKIGSKYKHFLGPKPLFQIAIRYIVKNIENYEDNINKLPADVIEEYFDEYKMWMYKNKM